MGEQLPAGGGEQLRAPERSVEHVEHKPKQEAKENHHEHKAEQPSVESIRAKVAHEAKSAKDTKAESASQKSSEPTVINRELKALMLQRTLVQIRKHLSAPSRAFSRVVHTPIVDKASAVGEKTVARPVGTLVGALFALIGSAYVYFAAKHYGFSYNFLIFVFLFLAGYVIATVIEALVYVVRRSSR